MTRSIPVDWWRPERVALQNAAPAASIGGDEPKGGRVAFWAVVCFTSVLLFTPQQWIPFLGVIRINFLIGGLAVAAYLIAPPKGKWNRFPVELQVALALVVWALLTIPTSYWPGSSLNVWLEWLKVVAVFWLIGQDVCSLSRLRTFAWVLAMSTVPLCTTALSNFSSGADKDRIVGFGNNLAANPNDLALSINLFLPVTVALALTARRKAVSLAMWALAGLSVGGVIVTFSRGGFITLVVEGALIVGLLVRRRAKHALTAAALCVVLGASFAPAGYFERLSTIFNLEADETGSAQARRQDTLAAVSAMFSHPIFGSGIGMGVLALNETRGTTWTDVHNAYLNYGLEMGVPGIALFVTLVIVSWRSAKRVEQGAGTQLPDELRTMASAIRISLVGFAVAAFFHPIGYDPYFYYLGAMAVALKTTATRQFGARGLS